MHYWELKDQLRLETTPSQDFACLFLEHVGKKFCVDFGYENALEMARKYPQFHKPKWIM